MEAVLVNLLARLADRETTPTEVIDWGAPVPSFGDYGAARVATLGLNPSNREFVDNHGLELTGSERRFPTLSSLELDCWSAATETHIGAIADSLRNYFHRNPYDRWFKSLDYLLGGTGCSYYEPGDACHLDLVPFATSQKWGALSRAQRNALLDMAGGTLGQVIRESQITALILNGRSVVDLFEHISGVTLMRRSKGTWALPRRDGSVPGVAYEGEIDHLLGVDLGRRVSVLGWNHNIQSSFGVTRRVRTSIRHWLGKRCAQAVA